MRAGKPLNPDDAARHTPLTSISDEQEVSLIRRIGNRDRDALAEQHRVVSQNYAHGILALTVVPTPGGRTCSGMAC